MIIQLLQPRGVGSTPLRKRKGKARQAWMAGRWRGWLGEAGMRIDDSPLVLKVGVWGVLSEF